LKVLRENVSEEALEVYLQLGMRSAHLAERQGANREKIAEILEKITLAKKNLKC
jgi:tetrahydrodipicolinate N-succinyltransferase